MADSRPLSFATDVRPLFTDTDVEHMKNYGLDLSDRDNVAKEAKSIFAVVTAGTMPPPADGGEPWSQDMCEIFRQWMDQGCPP